MDAKRMRNLILLFDGTVRTSSLTAGDRRRIVVLQAMTTCTGPSFASFLPLCNAVVRLTRLTSVNLPIIVFTTEIDCIG